ncbi:related to cytochrome P450 7A1 [Phialocephala subalpina]|uniref:Related to cytochrome P450 7A1 n=1 Tax=Phialocephala subalpina TaxID=576137 RepID=A0A1L7WF37_9HELO|nr:related to cytochrome P450 7A1 [Phialocephala subalpina]
MAFSATVLGGAITIYIFLRLLLRYTQDAKEPLTILTSIPFLSPILGMAARKTSFYAYSRDKYGLPIYILRLPGTRMYVVNSTALITTVQRQFITLAFPPIETRAAINVMGASEAGKAMLMKNLDPKERNWDKGYAASYAKAIHPAMSPGPGLDAMNRVAILKIAESLDTLRGQTPQIIMNLFSSLLAKESLVARKLMVDAFEQYFRKDGHKHGSALIKARYDHSVSFNASLNDIARFEIGGAVAIFANTGPAASWLIYHIHSDPMILSEIRSEVSKVVAYGPDESTIGISNVKASCPILLSTFQEVMRFRSIGTSARVVMEDHMLDGKYLLKKGATVMIPGAVQHSLPSVWGDNVAEFDHKRFIRSGTTKRPNPVAFRGFGGGTTLCPGRHFASTEILAFASLMVLRFDIKPVGGKWMHATAEQAEMWSTVPLPDTDIAVEVTPRKGSDMSEKWKVIYSGSDKAMELSAEDMAGK